MTIRNNIDAYVSASNREVKGFKSFIYEIIHRQQGPAGGTTQGPRTCCKKESKWQTSFL